MAAGINRGSPPPELKEKPFMDWTKEEFQAYPDYVASVMKESPGDSHDLGEFTLTTTPAPNPTMELTDTVSGRVICSSPKK